MNMVCENCGQLRLVDSERFLVCPNCDEFCTIYSKEETIKEINESLKRNIMKFHQYITSFNLNEVIMKLQ